MTATCWGWLRHLLQMPCWVRSSHTGQCKVVKYCAIVPFRPSSSLREELVAFWIYTNINSEISLSQLYSRVALLMLITGSLRHYFLCSTNYRIATIYQALFFSKVPLSRTKSFLYSLISSDILFCFPFLGGGMVSERYKLPVVSKSSGYII